MIDTIARWFCRMFHARYTRQPINGYYVCGRCLRRYPVLWGKQHAGG